MRKSTGNALCAAIISLTAIFAVTRGDIGPAAPMFLLAVFFSLRARRDWNLENG